MDNNKYELYHETKNHTPVDFPYNTYICTIPLDFKIIPTHWHDEFEMIVIKKGKGTVRVDLTPYNVNAGDIIFIIPGQLHSIEQKDNYTMEYENIIFKQDLLRTRGQDYCNDLFINPLLEGLLDFSCHINNSLEYYQEFSSCIEHIDELCSSQPLGYQLMIKSYLYKCIFILVANNSFTKKIGQKKSLEKIKIVISFIRENYHRPISIEEISDLCHYSQSHFMKFFKSMLGMGFTQYLNDYRLELASRMLLATSDNILDIALQCGFENLSYFNRIFKRKYGVTPGRYRQSI